jgi:hypothetical protein
MKRTFVRNFCIVSTLLLVGSGCTKAAPQTETPETAKRPAAFGAINEPGQAPAALQSPEVRRIRRISMNLELFDDAKAQSFLGTRQTQSVEMNFFPDTAINVEWNQVERVKQPAGYMWIGTVAGSPAGRANLVISGKNVTANVTRGDGLIYEIRTAADGVWWAREIDQSKFPQEAAPVVPNR